MMTDLTREIVTFFTYRCVYGLWVHRSSDSHFSHLRRNWRYVLWTKCSVLLFSFDCLMIIATEFLKFVSTTIREICTLYPTMLTGGLR